MDENNTYINKSEKEALEIMENVSDITSDQLQALRENEECFQTCSDIAEAVIGMQMEKNALSINTQQALADFHRKHLDRRNKKLYILWTSVAGVAATIIIILVLRMMSFSPESDIESIKVFQADHAPQQVTLQVAGEEKVEPLKKAVQSLPSSTVKLSPQKIAYNTIQTENKKIRNMPILRGVFSFIESLVLGMQTLTYSASFFEDEEVDKKKKEPMTEEERRRQEQKEKKQENAMMGGTVVLSIVLAVAVFMMLPYYLSTLFQKVITSQWVIALLEGVIRLVIFIGYVALISLMKDIRRVYMYHGAEHKCINCIEHGMDLTVDNVRKSSRFHKRCGTSFLLIVMLVSILFFMFIRVDSPILRVVLRLLLIPVIAGVSYEFIRLAGRSDNAVVNLLSKPGLWLQGLTTKEPDDEMIEVGIASVEVVFDWKPYVEEIRREMK